VTLKAAGIQNFAGGMAGSPRRHSAHVAMNSAATARCHQAMASSDQRWPI
jgi:hypothetical protein